ncbi:hypothetical protein DITRI_Ditri04bG0205700 [Diplodiscus trichospermus]
MEQKIGNYKSDFKGKVKEDMDIVAVHSQVRKIKKESQQIIDWSPGQPEMRIVLRQQLSPSPSPLGLSGRPIFFGH